MSGWWEQLGEEDRSALENAYEVLTRIGRQTADHGRWDHYLDRAQHALGLILALNFARRPPCPHGWPPEWETPCPLCTPKP